MKKLILISLLLLSTNAHAIDLTLEKGFQFQYATYGNGEDGYTDYVTETNIGGNGITCWLMPDSNIDLDFTWDYRLKSKVEISLPDLEESVQEKKVSTCTEKTADGRCRRREITVIAYPEFTFSGDFPLSVLCRAHDGYDPENIPVIDPEALIKTVKKSGLRFH